MKNTNAIYSVILTAFLVAMLSFGFKSYDNAKKYEKTIIKISEKDDIYGNFCPDFICTGAAAKIKQLQKQAQTYKSTAEKYLAIFTIILGIVLWFSWFVNLKFFTIFGSLGSLIALGYGIFSPAFMIKIHTDVVSVESKSIIDSIEKMFSSGENLMAIMVLLFSIIVPISKIIVPIAAAYWQDYKYSFKVLKIFKTLGKWSMLDVFVVATLLVFFATNGKVISSAELEVGIYFFSIYVVSSMFLSGFALKVLKNK